MTLSVIGGSAKSCEFWENSPPLSNFGVLLENFLIKDSKKKVREMEMQLAVKS